MPEQTSDELQNLLLQQQQLQARLQELYGGNGMDTRQAAGLPLQPADGLPDTECGTLIQLVAVEKRLRELSRD